MSLSQDERRVMVQLEIERAERIMAEFPIYIENKLWNTLANRMYYTIFHATTALLIANGMYAGTHQGVYVLLSQHFIKGGKMSQDEGRLFSRLATMRERGDYNCFIDTTEEELTPMLEPLKAYVEHIKQLVIKQ